ncbi:MAG: DUF1385 domain-containing protein [archaeon]
MKKSKAQSNRCKPGMESRRAGKTPAMGGQAVIEGVLMKGLKHYAVAVRRPDKRIHTEIFPLTPPAEKVAILGWPIVRGVANLFQMMSMGMSALTWSANQQVEKEEREELTGGKLTLTIIFSILLALVLFKALPLGMTKLLTLIFPAANNTILFNIIDGLLRITIFVAYIAAISLMNDVKRLFQYHGAEHMSVHCLEAKKPLTVRNVAAFDPKHARCGTSFIFLVLIIAIIVFSIVPIQQGFLSLLLWRIPLLLPIAGISYEVLRLSARHQESFLFRALSRPGIWLQNLTTRKPDADQIEVAIRSLKAVLIKEGSIE